MTYTTQRIESAFRRLGFDPFYKTTQEVIGRENEAIEQALLNAKTHGVLVTQPRIGDLVALEELGDPK